MAFIVNLELVAQKNLRLKLIVSHGQFSILRSILFIIFFLKDSWYQHKI